MIDVLNKIKAVVLRYKLKPIKDVLTKNNQKIIDAIQSSIEKYETGKVFNFNDMKKATQLPDGKISNHNGMMRLQSICEIIPKIQDGNIANNDIWDLIEDINNFEPVTEQSVALRNNNDFAGKQEKNTIQDIAQNSSIILNKELFGAIKEGKIPEEYHFLIADFKREIDRINQLQQRQGHTF